MKVVNIIIKMIDNEIVKLYSLILMMFPVVFFLIIIFFICSPWFLFVGFMYQLYQLQSHGKKKKRKRKIRYHLSGD